MVKLIKAVCLLSVLSLFSHVTLADSVIGVWKTIDDETDKEKSLVQITENTHGELEGYVIKLFNDPAALCDKCQGDKKNKPIHGMQILWGLKKDDNQWKNGKILDPKTGKIYTASIKLIDEDKKLRVRGYIGPFFRTQEWQRQ